MSPTGTLTVNTLAIANNWHLLLGRMQRVNAGNRCAAVVKADAYGLGVKPVAQSLLSAGCTEFFVASLDEAIELRDCLGQKPQILVFGGLTHGLGSEWVDYNLIPVLIDLAHVDQWRVYCRQHQGQFPCAVKADTGMHRLGVPANELLDSLQSPDLWSDCNVRYFLSHLACADTPRHPLNRQQQQLFNELSSAIKVRYPNVVNSLANSSGLFLGDDFCFDLGRPGIALYGSNPTPGKKNPMQTVVQLELPVMQCRTIKAGEMVGYGATFKAARETRLATVFGGYADGLLRLLSNRAKAYYGGQAVPLVGRVSMDSLIFDVTDLKERPNSLTILNNIQTVDHLAGAADTIGYEILTSLGKRYQRNYLG